MQQIKVNLPDIIGKGYTNFWKCRQRYRVVKGSRGSKKSATTSLWYIWNILKYPLANVLVVRRFFNTHKDSTYAQLKWAMNRLKVAHLFECSKNPLEIKVKATGQKIMFRGLDNPDSVTSVTVETGVLCWAWIEEAFQITNEDDFNKLDTSIRGNVPEGYFKQLTLTFNPWSAKHWLKRRFFDEKNDQVFAITTTFRCNEWLDQADLDLFAWMKVHNPRRFRIEGNGDWGISEGLVFDNWEERDFDWKEMLYAKEVNTQRFLYQAKFGLDFGYTNDPTAFIALLVDKDKQELYVFDEMYKTRLKNSEIAQNIRYKGFGNELIIGDSSEPKTIDDLKDMPNGLPRIRGAKKGKGSVNTGIQKLQDYKIIVHPRCPNTIVELSNYTWALDKDGKVTNNPIDEYNHLMDALRYATEDLRRSTFSFD